MINRRIRIFVVAGALLLLSLVAPTVTIWTFNKRGEHTTYHIGGEIEYFTVFIRPRQHGKGPVSLESSQSLVVLIAGTSNGFRCTTIVENDGKLDYVNIESPRSGRSSLAWIHKLDFAGPLQSEVKNAIIRTGEEMRSRTMSVPESRCLWFGTTTDSEFSLLENKFCDVQGEPILASHREYYLFMKQLLDQLAKEQFFDLALSKGSPLAGS